MFTDIENRLILTGILAGLLVIMLWTGQMSFASATFGLIVGVITPVSHIVSTTKEVFSNGKD